MKLTDLIKSLKEDQTISTFYSKLFDKNFVEVSDEDHHIIRLFQWHNKEELKEVNSEQMIEEIATYLETKVNLKAFLKDVVSREIPQNIFDLYSRIHHKKPKVKEDKGCYSLSIYGKRGRPFKLWLKEP